MRTRLIPVVTGILLIPTLTFPQSPVRDTHPADDFTVREEMVPMRDGVKLYTVILTPKPADEPLPILLERTPYDAIRILGGNSTTLLEVALGPKYLGGGFIYVAQDIRGRFKSEGEFAMYRVPRGSFNQSQTDETTDAWDTIEWLVENTGNNNGKLGVWGTSYPGWLTLAAIREPHPALAAAVPFNPVVDVWKADDWFHWGAFRAGYAFEYIYEMVSGSGKPYPVEIRDRYAWIRAQGAAGTSLGPLFGSQPEMWARLMENPSYGPYWQACAADQWFESPARSVPTLTVHGYWDQEDIYGAPAAYQSLEENDPGNDRNFFAAGPWYHGQHWADGSQLGALGFDEDTALRFRQDVLEPFLRRFLKDSASPAPAQVTVFETGTNRWRNFDKWPPRLESRRIYLQPDRKVGFRPPPADGGSSSFVSDPANPVPYAPRPHWGVDYGDEAAIAAWRRWLVEDQRFVEGRPDVASWVGPPLDQELTVRGPITAHLMAETNGTDADWVIKLIDVYPDQNPGNLNMSGYQLMVSADILRGRYRENYEEARPLLANRVLAYALKLPHVNHRFRKGHRIMVQVQSTWFPLYDRNPQTFVPSIMFAPPEAYQARVHRVHHSAASPTFLEVLVDDGD